MAQPVSNPEKPSSDLRTRVISAVVLAPPVLAALYLGGLHFDLLAIFAAALMAWEWCALVTGQRKGAGSIFFVSGILISLFVFVFFESLYGFSALLVCSAAILVVGKILYADQKIWVLAGVPYVGLPVMALIWVRGIEGMGMAYLALLLLAVWATDIGAYFSGRTIGGPKIVPKISPKKTWAGLIGGMACSGLIAAIVGNYFQLGELFPLFLLGAVLALVAQIGDFYESWVKRKFNVKDSSNLIPGHGGILDRVDGIMSAAIFLWIAIVIGLFKESAV